MAQYTKDNVQEIPDKTPVEIPLNYEAPESLESMIARMVSVEMSAIAKKGGFETFEESDDFDIDDTDGVPVSTHQMTQLEEEYPRERFGKSGKGKSEEKAVQVEKHTEAAESGNKDKKVDGSTGNVPTSDGGKKVDNK